MADALNREGFTAREDFPVLALPRWAAEYVIALSYVLQVEPVVIALSVLGATAIAVQAKAELAVRGGWVEPLSFWALVALRSGNRKTPALLRPLRPLRDHERAENELRERYRERLREKRSSSREGKGKRDPSEPDPWKAAEPPTLELFGSDLTPESLAVALAEQQESYAIVTDEPTSLAEILGGLYSEGKKANTGIYMAGYSGSPYRRRRVKGSNARLERPALSMLLIGQPSVFADLTSRSALIDLGFVGRFLVAKPLDHLGVREIHDESVPEAVAARYAERFREIIAVPPREPFPDLRAAWLPDPPPEWPAGAPLRYRLAMTEDARALHSDTEALIEPLLAEGAALSELSDFGAKLSGLVARCAGLLHVLHHPTTWHEDPVDVVTMGHAIEIGRYALGEVLRIWSQRAQDVEGDELSDHVFAAMEGLAAREGGDSLTWAVVRRRFLSGNGRGRLKSVDDLLAILELLVARGELEEAPTGNGRGRRWRLSRKLDS